MHITKKKREMENKDPIVVMHTRNSNAPTTTEDNTQTAKEPLQK
jgi:hypothetical protein